MQYLDRENEEDDALPTSLADELDENEEARRLLASMQMIDTSLYDLRGSAARY